MSASRMRAIGDCFVAETAVITGDVKLLTGANIWFGCVLRGDVVRLTVGKNVNLQDGCIVHADHDAPQVIEEGVVAGHLALLHGVRIGRGTLCGIGCRLLGGSVVGEECIIAAGAIVTERTRIPPRSLVMGIPGKVVRPVTEEEVRRTQSINQRYLELARQYAAGAFPPPWMGQ